jgi:hypothetical protein
VTVPFPSSVFSLCTSVAASNLTCVAQAVESAMTSSSPSVKAPGLVWAAIAAPTISSHRPNTDPTAAAVRQPWSSSSPPMAT